MKTLAMMILVVGSWWAVERSRGMPAWCYDSVDHAVKCVGISVRSVWTNEPGNVWKNIQPAMMMDDVEHNIDRDWGNGLHVKGAFKR